MDRTDRNSFILSLIVHGVIFTALIISNFLEKPQIIKVSGNQIKQQNKPIIKAGLIDHKAVEIAIARQNKQERDKKEQLNRQRINAEKLKKEAEKIKLETQKLQKDIAEAKKVAEKEKQQALLAKETAEKLKLQASKEQEKAKLAKEQAEQKFAQIKQAEEKAALEKKQTLEEQARQRAIAAKKAEEQRMHAEHNRWINNELSRYAGEIERRIRENRTISTAFSSELKCDIQIKLLPDGSVHEVKIIRSSGNAAYDSISEAAVYKAAPFDMPEDRELQSRLRDIVVGLRVADE